MSYRPAKPAYLKKVLHQRSGSSSFIIAHTPKGQEFRQYTFSNSNVITFVFKIKTTNKVSKLN